MAHFSVIADRLLIALNLGILALWLRLWTPALEHMAGLFGPAHLRESAWALVGALLLVTHRAWRSGCRPHPAARIQAGMSAWGLLCGASLAYLAAERLWDVRILSDLLFGLASYGLVGLWMRPAAWRAGLPGLLLLLAALPFGHHLDTFLGYPLRLATARAVQSGLAASGIAAVASDTILVFENGISGVDLPCSGLRGLWAGAIFYLAATLIEGRRPGLRWLLGGVLLAGLLLAANLLRVSLLVILGPVLDLPMAAEMLHLPLGLLGFGLACAAGLGVLRRLPEDGSVAASVQLGGMGSARSWSPENWASARKPAMALLILLLSFNLAHRPRLAPAADLAGPARGEDAALDPGADAGVDPAAYFPAAMHPTPLPLDAPALAWLLDDGADLVVRARFDFEGLGGSALLVRSRSWRAHHLPERCFEVYGLKISSSSPQILPAEDRAKGQAEGIKSMSAPHLALRYVSLSPKRPTALGAMDPDALATEGPGDLDATGQTLSRNKPDRVSRAAIYWFQSAERSTDDYASRIWADLAEPQTWVMASLLFDGAPAADAPAIARIRHLLAAEIDRQLQDSASLPQASRKPTE